MRQAADRAEEAVRGEVWAVQEGQTSGARPPADAAPRSRCAALRHARQQASWALVLPSVRAGAVRSRCTAGAGRTHRSADSCTRASRHPLHLGESAEIRTDRAGVCTVGWWGDDLAARPRPHCAARVVLARLRAERGWTFDELAGPQRSGPAHPHRPRTRPHHRQRHHLARPRPHLRRAHRALLWRALCDDHTPPRAQAVPEPPLRPGAHHARITRSGIRHRTTIRK